MTQWNNNQNNWNQGQGGYQPQQQYQQPQQTQQQQQQHIFCGAGKPIGRYGDIKLTIDVDEILKHVKQGNNGNKVVYLILSERKNPSAGGSTHFIKVDTWEPNKHNQQQQFLPQQQQQQQTPQQQQQKQYSQRPNSADSPFPPQQQQQPQQPSAWPPVDEMDDNVPF